MVDYAVDSVYEKHPGNAGRSFRSATKMTVSIAKQNSKTKYIKYKIKINNISSSEALSNDS